MKNLLKKFSFLFALIITLSLPTSAAQASTCPPHDYYHNGTIQVYISSYEHTVFVEEYNPYTGHIEFIPKACYVRVVHDVYKYSCRRSNCITYFTENGDEYEIHSF